ncbi:MAG: mRNA surveillance protein pelota [Euryarchaeota archaeon]|jgi:protein pelota|uniref:mRNA surveillance protein pelota n=1 Tax=Methanobacterium sp. MZD130B TaxID=3394378 RepID=UPI0009CD331C|nr:mRNA surveillance protein pelota [Euryarchaeota archaeon]OPZ91666.1 MAG: peptide chain release factor 1 [Firmicutes bacterium ADurb.Bin419]HHT19302.1 mRNA surveillance protein pelota [Methanobacterium sp.]
MRIIHQDAKRGIIELLPETLDDLWHLSHLIEPGDLISSKTTRRMQDTSGERLRSDRGIKKTFFMGIRVENINFHKYTGKLRAKGIIEKGPEDLVSFGSHHTIDLKLSNSVRIEKERWSRWHQKRIKEAIDASKIPRALVVVIEDDVADMGILRQYGVEYYGPIIGGVTGKRVVQKNRQQVINKFYDEIASTINNFEGIEGIIIAGPGFGKNDFHHFISEKYPYLAKISRLENTGAGGRTGIYEVLQKGILEEMATEGRIAHEIRMMARVLEEIGKTSNKVVYGKKETKIAAEAGAIENLLIIDELLRERDVEKIMDMTENLGGSVMVLSSEHDGGKQLSALGGLAALLRYALN